MGANGSLISLVVFALIGSAPLSAASFVGRRMGYRGFALVAPWLVALALGLLIGLGLGHAQLEPVGGDGGTDAVSVAASRWIAALMLSGYFTTLIYLIVLAARRLPARPADAASVF